MTLSVEACKRWAEEIRATLAYYQHRGCNVAEATMCYGLQNMLIEAEAAIENAENGEA